MTKEEIKKELKQILKKIDANTTSLWCSDLEGTCEATIMEDYYDKMYDEDNYDPDDESPQIEYNGWCKDLENLIKKIK